MTYHFKDYSIQMKLIIGFIIVLAISFISILFSNSNSSKIIDDTDRIIHTHMVLTDISEIEAKLIDLETGQRGYIITGNPDYLTPYNNSLKILDEKLEHLKEITSDNPNQTKRIVLLKASVKQKLAELALTIRLRQTKGFDAAKEVVMTDEGKIIMDKIRQHLSEIQKEELRMLDIRSVKPEQSRIRTNRILYALLLLTIITTVWITYLISKSISTPLKKLKNSTQIVGEGNLQHQIDISSKDEIGQLATSFQNMMQKLQSIMTSREELQKEIEYRKEIEKSLLETRDVLVQNERELTKSNSTKDKLFSILAHDLRTPFNSMIGFADILYNDYETLSEKEVREYINIIYNGLESTYELLNNLLIWSKDQKGKLENNPLQQNLFLLSKHTIDTMQISTKEKSILLNINIPNKLNVIVDENLYQTILRNLVSNAIKFTPKQGTVTLEAESKWDSRNNKEYIQIKVQDNGVGIAEHLKPMLFDIGEKYSTRGTEDETGSGLGLSLCKEFVEKSGGEIWFESKLNEGSTFYFTLPASNA